MKLHLYGHSSKTYGTVSSMCSFHPSDGEPWKHFTTTDRIGRGEVSQDDVCKKCLDVLEEFHTGKRCCTDPTCHGTEQLKALKEQIKLIAGGLVVLAKDDEYSIADKMNDERKALLDLIKSKEEKLPSLGTLSESIAANLPGSGDLGKE